ncbi:Flagellar biosynthetic protein FliR [Sporomusa ovata DSM 2662]|uniref:Flagellar biosynthetic protein FliR n=1 Tax=Sporomusa ovata TaxID=2378 RepID=A0A0U1KVL4_9FIRM|nr:flagellar biosynthetic protein FliR [Sporomusa ovata]EQB29450.1 flagellar biosynthetic protein FliR [Sporomusa ovata DSM 2662]CQR71500.1 Flagellar biosynthesis protein FliR [Sporomusa ovata]
MDLFTLLQNQLGFFLLIFARLSGIFSSAPIFGAKNVPLIVKAGLSLLISYILLPLLIQSNLIIPDAILTYVAVVVGEFLIGLIMGFACSFIFYGIQMAGTLLDTQIGFGMVNVIDPQFGQQVPLVGNFKYILAILVFLTSNSHHLFISAIVYSFTSIPVTRGLFRPELANIVVDMVGDIFIIAIKISLPVVVAVLLTDVALGILARTMPQMNIFVVGMPGKIIVGIFVLSLALPFYIGFLEVVFSEGFHNMYRLLESFAPS